MVLLERTLIWIEINAEKDGENAIPDVQYVQNIDGWETTKNVSHIHLKNAYKGIRDKI